MNTTFEVQLVEERAEYARQVATTLFAEVDRLEALLSKFDPRSDIAQLNRLKPGESISVSFEVHECLSLAARMYTETAGAFDVAFRTSGSTSALDWLVLSAPGSAEFFAGIRPSQPVEVFTPIEINLGGIGKGYALDKLREILLDWGIHSALLHSGTSSILAIGATPNEPGWTIGVGGNYAAICPSPTIVLTNSALGSSGTEVQGEHIIDPRSGKPANGHLATWVRADSAAEADTLSTAFMVMSPTEVRDFFASRENLSALLITNEDGCSVARKFGAWT